MARIFCGFCSSNGDFGLMIGRSSRSSLLPISASTLIKQQKLYGSEKNTFTCKAIYLPQSSESGFKPHSIRFSEPVYSSVYPKNTMVPENLKKGRARGHLNLVAKTEGNAYIL